MRCQAAPLKEDITTQRRQRNRMLPARRGRRCQLFHPDLRTRQRRKLRKPLFPTQGALWSLAWRTQTFRNEKAMPPFVNPERFYVQLQEITQKIIVQITSIAPGNYHIELCLEGRAFKLDEARNLKCE